MEPNRTPSTLLRIAAACCLLALPASADTFQNTGPGTINTCENNTQVGVSVASRDTLQAAYYSRLMVGANDNYMLGARIQLNMPAGNSNGRSAYLENYLHGGLYPVLRVLRGPTNGYSDAELSSWNLTNGDFWAAGRIATSVGFWVNSTQLNVPDYVFDPGYKLRSLDETERFVKANRHLPDVPSATQIRDEGLDMTAMNLKLLQKVEELTLHAIAQEKRIRKLERRLGKSL